MKRRDGAALVELLTTVVMIGLMAVACAALVRAQAQLLRYGSERAAANETLRAARTILRAELRDLAAADLRMVAPDSFAFRVFRGFGIVCALNLPRVTLRYHGVRLPDAAKDSVLLLAEERVGTIVRIAGSGACPRRANEQLVTLEPDVPAPLGSIVLFFESGAYHLAANALRYRRGASGMQPLTDDLIDHAASSFALDSARRSARITLRTRPGALGFAIQANPSIRFRNP